MPFQHFFYIIVFGCLECVGHSFFVAYVAHYVFLRDVWIRTQRAAVAGGATRLPTHPSPYFPTFSRQQACKNQRICGRKKGLKMPFMEAYNLNEAKNQIIHPKFPP